MRPLFEKCVPFKTAIAVIYSSSNTGHSYADFEMSKAYSTNTVQATILTVLCLQTRVNMVDPESLLPSIILSGVIVGVWVVINFLYFVKRDPNPTQTPLNQYFHQLVHSHSYRKHGKAPLKARLLHCGIDKSLINFTPFLLSFFKKVTKWLKR